MTFLNRHRSRIRPVGPFSPSSLFFGGIPGAWYDPTDLSTMFQDSTGTTPVTAVEQPVGRILDKSGNANHATQATAASRPTYRARYNLLTQSEDFSQAVWTKTSSTVSANTSVAPDGTTTADTLAEAAAVSFHGANHQSVSVPVGTTLTLSASFKKGTSRYAQLNFGGSGAVSRWVSCVIDLDTGSITQSSAGAQATLVSAVSSAQGNGWYRVSLTGSVQTDTSIFSYVNMVSTGTPTLGSYGVETYLGVITNNILIWGAQLLTAADVTATGNAYQRIAAATVYDTAPIFRPYLAFDGLDDSLSTAAINFTSTDKMTTFVGTTVNSDAAPGMITELSADGGANAGAFNVYRPGTGAYQFFRNGGTSFAQTVTGSFAAPSTGVVTYGLNFGAATEVTAQRVNGAASGAVGAADTGSGNFGTYPLFIGRRNNASLPFNGRLFSLIVRGAASSVTEIADTELWVNARTGGY